MNQVNCNCNCGAGFSVSSRAEEKRERGAEALGLQLNAHASSPCRYSTIVANSLPVDCLQSTPIQLTNVFPRFLLWFFIVYWIIFIRWANDEIVNFEFLFDQEDIIRNQWKFVVLFNRLWLIISMHKNS